MKIEEPKIVPKDIRSEVMIRRKYENRQGCGLSFAPYDEKLIRNNPPTVAGYVNSPKAKTM